MKLAFVLAYDGSAFHGSALQPQVATVVGGFIRALDTLHIEHEDLALAGRTDAGVHARYQVISLESPRISIDRYPRLQALLPDGVWLRAVMRVPSDFHARHAARWRQYRYRIRRVGYDPVISLAWHLEGELDIPAMEQFADGLVQVDEFDALCKVNSAGGYRRRVHSVELRERSGFVDVSVIGESFCHQMVRRIVGTLVQIGKGRMPVSTAEEAVGRRERQRLTELAPPRGLFLWRVGYQPAWEWARLGDCGKSFEEDWSVIDRLELPFPLEWSAECPHD